MRTHSYHYKPTPMLRGLLGMEEPKQVVSFKRTPYSLSVLLMYYGIYQRDNGLEEGHGETHLNGWRNVSFAFNEVMMGMTTGTIKLTKTVANLLESKMIEPQSISIERAISKALEGEFGFNVRITDKGRALIDNEEFLED